MCGSLFIAGISGLLAARRMASAHGDQIGDAHRGLKVLFICVLVFLFLQTLGGLFLLGGAQMEQAAMPGSKNRLSIRILLPIFLVVLILSEVWTLKILIYDIPSAQSQEHV